MSKSEKWKKKVKDSELVSNDMFDIYKEEVDTYIEEQESEIKDLKIQIAYNLRLSI